MTKGIKITVENSDCIPFKKHKTDAGFDLKINQPTFTIDPGQKIKVHTGVRIQIPRGHVGLVVPRSGLGTNFGINLANSVGIIDADYRGEILVYLINNGDKPKKLEQFERFAQLIIIPVFIGNLLTTAVLSETERGEGGFGHTGEE